MPFPERMAIIQAREGSTRLPSKVLLPLGRTSVIDHIYQRVRAVCYTVVAIPAADTELSAHLRHRAIPQYRYQGPAEDVLARFRGAVTTRRHIGQVLRITADCPFVQPDHMRAVLALGKVHDYVAMGPQSGFPDGLDCESIQRQVLDQACSDKEHVTAGLVPAALVAHIPDLSHHRWTLDTEDDYAWLTEVSKHLPIDPPAHPTMRELLNLILENPELGHYDPAATRRAAIAAGDTNQF